MKYTIKQLRQRGYKVRVLHSRSTRAIANLDGSYRAELLAHGGSTTIEVTTPDKQITVSGKSLCSSKDNFNRRVGNEIALGRAIEQLKTQVSEI